MWPGYLVNVMVGSLHVTNFDHFDLTWLIELVNLRVTLNENFFESLTLFTSANDMYLPKTEIRPKFGTFSSNVFYKNELDT